MSNLNPEDKESQETIEVLDHASDVMRRPLVLIDGVAYLATWLNARVTNGDDSHEERRLVVLSSKGRFYGLDKLPLTKLPFNVRLPEVPPPNKTLSTDGYRRFRRGDWPDPVDVFKRVTSVVNRFIDFSASLATQRVMCEFTACWDMATYLLDGLNVFGYLQPTGDRGSGKTQYLTLQAEISYLGQVILAGGSYATLRDLADYGATLCFDDAEGIMDAKRSDPDKRSLLLAGNRRGATVTVKEQVAKAKWETRHVNAFCPRAFSAIHLPDSVLGSRTVVVPLVRTADREKANSDVLEFSKWPCDQRKLIDNLWLIALRHLPEIPKLDAQVARSAPLLGRNLEPWRPVLAVAKLLDKHGAKGLYQRMETLARNYQPEKVNLESGDDLTTLVIQALAHFRDSRDSRVSSKRGRLKPTIHLLTSEIAATTRKIATDTEADLPEDVGSFINSLRVGRVMGKLRFKLDPNKKPRAWYVSLARLESLAPTYGVKLKHSETKRGKRGKRGNGATSME